MISQKPVCFILFFITYEPNGWNFMQETDGSTAQVLKILLFWLDH